MLQWNTRLLAVIVIVVFVAVLIGDMASWEGFQFGW